MALRSVRGNLLSVLSALMLTALMAGAASAIETPEQKVETALDNISALVRPGFDGYATIWDGNKYLQCRRTAEQIFRCEAAGTLMQPSLTRVLTPERIARLGALGWQLDTSFGNYVRLFPASATRREISEQIVQTLKDVYDADAPDLDIATDWIKSESCPPRNGPGQNLAGMVNDARSMARVAIHTCAYTPPQADTPAVIQTRDDMIKHYGRRVSAELQRLRVNVNAAGSRFVVLETGGGYIQCMAQQPRAIYCEAQSDHSWPVLSRILTPERRARLISVGFTEPGRSPNFSKTYALDSSSDQTISDELLTILLEVYGYDGSPALRFKSEKG